jgi:hypothetical protein
VVDHTCSAYKKRWPLALDRGTEFWDGRRACDFGSSTPSFFRFVLSLFFVLTPGTAVKYVLIYIYIHTHRYFIRMIENLCHYTP